MSMRFEVIAAEKTTENGQTKFDFSRVMASKVSAGTYAVVGEGNSANAGGTTFAVLITEEAGGGKAGGGDGLSMNDAETMISAFGYSNFMKTELINWGMKGAKWGKVGENYLNFHLKAGKIAGYAGAVIYGYNSYSSFANGNNLQGVSNGLMTMFSIIATKGKVPGMILTAPFFAIDWTVGMDNFLLYNINYGIGQSNQIQNGNWGVSLWRPGKALR